MHELSLCVGILEVLEEEASKQGFERVVSVSLEIGRLSCIEPEAMLFSFEAVVRDSLADGAKLEIIDLPGEAQCQQCRSMVIIEQRFDACPQCGSYQLKVTGGDEMKIKQLEVA